MHLCSLSRPLACRLACFRRPVKRDSGRGVRIESNGSARTYKQADNGTPVASGATRFNYALACTLLSACEPGPPNPPTCLHPRRLSLSPAKANRVSSRIRRGRDRLLPRETPLATCHFHPLSVRLPSRVHHQSHTVAPFLVLLLSHPPAVFLHLLFSCRTQNVTASPSPACVCSIGILFERERNCWLFLSLSRGRRYRVFLRIVRRIILRAIKGHVVWPFMFPFWKVLSRWPLFAFTEQFLFTGDRKTPGTWRSTTSSRRSVFLRSVNMIFA